MSIPTSHPSASASRSWDEATSGEFFSPGSGDDANSGASSSTHHSQTQRQRAQENYHQTLVDLGMLWVIESAKNGWTPADLRHEFTAQIDPLLFHSLSGIACNIPDDLLDHWFAETCPGSLHSISVFALEKIVNRLPLLPPLQDWRHLASSQGEDHDEKFLAALSPGQHKAHDRIQALLKKAESTTFEKEAEALVGKAEALRQQYRIEALLSDSYGGCAESAAVVSRRVRMHAPWVNYQMRLLGAIAHANACTTILLTPSGIATVFGSADDVDHVLDLFTSLNRQRAYFMRISAGARTAQERHQTSSYRRSFMVAYASRVGVLLRRAAEEVFDDLGATAPAAPGAIIPALKKRSQQARKTMDSVFPHTRGMSVSATNSLGVHDGYEAAARSHFSGDSSGLSGQRQLTDGNSREHFPT